MQGFAHPPDRRPGLVEHLAHPHVPQGGREGAASTSKRGERSYGSKGNPAREVTISNPADFPDPALGGRGPLSVSLALRGVVHPVFYRAHHLCPLSKLVPLRALLPWT